MAYERRIIDDRLDSLFPEVAAISLDGPKNVGKTATATRRATTVFRMDDPTTAQLFDADPSQFARRDRPVLIDEWQKNTATWDFVRRQVDDDRTGGQWLLTGSADPRADTHSGAGRIVSLRMRPLSFAERGIQEPTISLSALAEGTADIAGDTEARLETYVKEIVSSGFPGIRDLGSTARRAQLDGYITRIVDRDFEEVDGRVRRPQTLREWLSAYAAAAGSTADYSTILRAATPGQAAKPDRRTVDRYVNTLRKLWLLDDVPAWNPGQSDFSRVGATAKHFLADPALAARLLSVTEEFLLDGNTRPVLGPQDGTTLGRLFESLVALSLKVYAEVSEADVFHLRTRNGDHEIDFIVRDQNRRTLAFEVKLSAKVDASDVKHLLWLKRELGQHLVDMAVIYTGPYAYRRQDGVAVIPLALLGP